MSTEYLGYLSSMTQQSHTHTQHRTHDMVYDMRLRLANKTHKHTDTFSPSRDHWEPFSAIETQHCIIICEWHVSCAEMLVAQRESRLQGFLALVWTILSVCAHAPTHTHTHVNVFSGHKHMLSRMRWYSEGAHTVSRTFGAIAIASGKCICVMCIFKYIAKKGFLDMCFTFAQSCGMRVKWKRFREDLRLVVIVRSHSVG